MKCLVLAALTLAATPVLATTYTLEPNYTQVVISWDHLGFSHPTAQIAQGTGVLEFDPAQPTMSSLEVTLPVTSLITGVPDLDEHLKSADFFDVAKFPRATFRSTRVEKGMAKDQLEVTGDLTVRDVTRPVTLHVQVLKLGDNPRTGVATVGFNATGLLRRSDFKLDAFVPQVSDEIALRITCQGAEALGQAAFLKGKEEKARAKKQ
ncbi:MAG TPA: YceI family protein [Steroidobacteraceae bacterium]|nr:YceI family protein [Steroidobacteraceae bacterium]